MPSFCTAQWTTTDPCRARHNAEPHSNQRPCDACQQYPPATTQHPTASSLHTPELTHKHPQALAAHPTKPMLHYPFAQPTSYLRSRHPRSRPGPAAEAHTPRVLSHWPDEVPSGRPTAQHSQPQPTHAVHDTMQSDTATSNHVMLVSNTQAATFAHPSSHTNIHKRSRHPAQSPCHTIRVHSQPATHAHDIHARAPVQQQKHTLHVSFLTGTMKCRPVEYLHSTVNRNRPMPCTTQCSATLQPATMSYACQHSGLHW
jgi:hypothetical protein